jgi:CMP-N,N'-diacetyllegionaminic acid synthase
MTYVFDIDGTICETEDSDYNNSRPKMNRIDYINRLYDDGHKIFFLTARGMGRSDNSSGYAYTAFYDMTKEQLTDWGVKFHGLFLGKPHGDIYVDDKGMKDENFFGN